MFDKVARFVIRRSKFIIIAWIVALLVAIPFAPQVFNVLHYEETSMAPSNIDSEIAQRFINQHFGDVSSQGTTIVVLNGPNVLGNETKNVVLSVTNEIFNATHDGRIDAQVDVNSIYSSGKLYLAGMLLGISQNYPLAVEQINSTAFVIFGIPKEFQSIYNSTNQTAFVVYGIPYMYYRTWQGAFGSLSNVDAADNTTYSSVKATLQSQMSGMDAEQQMLLNGWYRAFTAAWNVTSSIPGLNTNAPLRAETAHSAAFPTLMENLSTALPADQLGFLSLVNSSFGMANYSDFHGLSNFTHSLLNQNIDSKLGGLSQSEASLVNGYIVDFFQSWSSSPSSPNESTLRAIVEGSVSSLSSSLPSDQAHLVSGIYSSLGWSDWNNSAAIQAFGKATVAVASDSESWVIDEVVALGPNPSLGSIMSLATAMIQDSSLTNFPIPLPQELINGFISPDNKTMIISLTYTKPTGDPADGKAFVGEMRNIVHTVVQGTSLTTYITGSDPINNDMQDSLNNDLHLIEPITIILVLVLIGLYFRSFIASSIPPLFIGLALGIAFAAVYFIGAYVLSIHYSVVTLMLTSMMGAGCDYCIFILSRYREERRSGRKKVEAVNTAVSWAGESIATSGATVIIGFGVLSLGRFSMLQSMGVSLALGVTIALLAALTLLPSAIVIAGDRIFWPARLSAFVDLKNKGAGYFTRTAKFSIKHAKAILIAALLISVPATYLVYTLDTSYDFIAAMPNTESKTGLNVMTDGFGGGKMMPTYVALNLSSPLIVGDGFNITELNAIENLSEQIAALNSVKQVLSPTRPLGETINYGNFSSYSTEEATQLKSMMRGMVGNDQQAVLINVILVSEPFSQTSISTISSLREIAATASSSQSIQVMYVGGSTASMKDISDMVGTDFSTIEIVVVIGIYVVLLLVLGSIINPLRSILTILLSISWTLAATMVIFQFYLQTAILWMLPMILLVVCLGLGMDYDILLTTRIREEASRGRSNNDAIIHSVERTGGIITACGIIMAAAFGSMMLSQSALLKEFGFALMFAILLDATVVRIYLVPAIMSLLGDWNWWAPGPLRRVERTRRKHKLEEMRQLQAEEAEDATK